MYIEPYYVRCNTIETANRYQLSRPYNLIFTARSENPKARIVLKVFYFPSQDRMPFVDNAFNNITRFCLWTESNSVQ